MTVWNRQSNYEYALNVKTEPFCVYMGVDRRVVSGSLHESLVHECSKAYVCVLYASPCAPLLVLWPGEVVRWTWDNTGNANGRMA